LNEEKKQQVIALGRLGWSLRRIQQNTGVRRETAGVYLKSAGIAIRSPGGCGRPSPAKPANEVITDLAPEKSSPAPAPGMDPAKPANEVITDSGADLSPAATTPKPQPGHNSSASACTAHREQIELGLSRGRNAMAIWQDLVDGCGFTAGYRDARSYPAPWARAQVWPAELAHQDGHHPGRCRMRPVSQAKNQNLLRMKDINPDHGHPRPSRWSGEGIRGQAKAGKHLLKVPAKG
jgi:hypothetical protein